MGGGGGGRGAGAGGKDVRPGVLLYHLVILQVVSALHDDTEEESSPVPRR